MTVSINGTSGIVNDATDLNYTGTLTGGTGVVNLGSGQVYKDASGNVGIGVTSPHSLLSVAPGTFGANSNTVGCSFSVDSTGASQPISGFRWTGASAGLGSTYATQWVSDSANSLSTEMYTTGATPLVFGTNSSERARIDSSGNLLVGTTTGDGTFSVTGNSGGTYYPAAFKDNRPTVDGSTSCVIFKRINTVVGSITTTASSTAYVTSSDYRLKEAIAPMTGALATVAALKPVTYKWKSDGSDGQGFIAHELQAVVADCVHGEKDAVDADGNPQYQGIDTSFLVATLAAAIQELKALVDEQSILIASQATRITALEGTT